MKTQAVWIPGKRRYIGLARRLLQQGRDVGGGEALATVLQPTTLLTDLLQR